MTVQFEHLVLNRCPDLSGSTWVVLAKLAWRANEDYICWPSIATIAADARVSKRTVDTAVAELKAAGYISADVRVGVGAVYTIHIDRIDAAVLDGVDEVEDTNANIAPPTQELRTLDDVPTQILRGTNAEIASVPTQILRTKVNKGESLKESIHYDDDPPTPLQPERDVGVGVGAFQWLHKWACMVLEVDNLSPPKHRAVVAFHDRWGGDARLTEALMEYAKDATVEAGANEPMQYWLRILRKRMENPLWVSVEVELAEIAARKEREVGAGLGAGGGTGAQAREGRSNGADRPADSRGIVGVIEAQNKPIDPNWRATLEKHIAAHGKPKPEHL